MMPLALIELTTPAMLGGLALLSLPVIAHLLNRHARRRIVFPTLMLLRASAATQSQLFRLRRYILLFLRCAIVALIVAAFARPVWLDAKTDDGLSGDNTAVVLLIDSSASTAQQLDGVSLIHRLRVAALRTLDDLDDGSDVANIVFATAQPRALMPQLSRDVSHLRQQVSEIESTYERPDLLKALAVAGEQLSQHNGPRQLVILSDLQQSNWQEVVDQPNVGQFLPRETNVTIIETEPAQNNVSLSSPRAFPSQPVVGQPVQLQVHASNFAAESKQLRIDMELDGQAVSNQTVTLAAGEQRDVAFETTVADSENHEVTFRLPTDDYVNDNQAYLVIGAQNRLPVIVVSDDNPDEPGTAAYFLERALAPHDDTKSDRYAVQHLTAAELGKTDLTPTSAVFIGYVADLNPWLCIHLLNYVKQGGGVLFFCGEGAVLRNLGQLEDRARPGGGILPWMPAPTQRLLTSDDVVYIKGGKWQSTFLNEFDEQSQIAISQIRFQHRWSAGPMHPAAQVLLTFSNDAPALAARQYGTGQFLLANFSPSLDSSDLGKYGSFVALVQSLARRMRTEADHESQVTVGQPYHFPEALPLAAGANVTVVNAARVPVPTVVTAAGDRIDVRIDATDMPGFYRLQRESETLASFAVNIDARERDLRRIPSELLSKQFQSDGAQFHLHSAGSWDPILDLHGRPLWGWFFTLAMVFVGLELICLSIWKR